ncbi:spore germination protein [Metabacillus litoralis]|uniref:spore germination protein n=1 Tax=Metabacillus litoralis TaxID=152268 RepID=UPI002041DE47|nr:spore germination protein [Metabacillus litoralis]MCM3161612.1 spore germination protein [Metabacillus litoralis]MCM3412567.1 spore germination protein [Metabacillus litoralis]
MDNPSQSSNIGFTPEGMKQFFSSTSDVVIESAIQENTNERLLLVYCEPLVDSTLLNEIVLPLINHHSLEETLVELKSMVQIHEKNKQEVTEEDLSHSVFSGKLMITTTASETIFYYNISKMPSRTPDESITEVSVRGPKDGFVEDLSTNLALVRKRLKSSSFIIEEYTIGRRSQTKVALLYIKDVINKELLRNIQEKLRKIEVDILTSSTQMEDLIIEKQVFSLFPLVNYTGRADYVVDSINQGRFSLIIDGAPTALLAPANLTFLIKTSEDQHTSFFFASVERILRLIGLFITIFLPGLYTALTTHNVGQLPLPLLATISISRMGLPFTSFIEVILMLVMFELFREAGARLPKGVGQTVAVLGGLIIGDAAIRGGITSPSMLVVIGVTAISSFTLVNQSLAGNIFIVRLCVVTLSFFAGIFGFIIGFISVAMYLSNLKSFGFSYLAIYTDITWKDLFSTYLKLPELIKDKRTSELKPKDSTRQGEK